MDITSIIKSGALVLCLLLVGCDKAQISNDAGDHIGVSITAPEIVVLGDVVNLTASINPHGDLDIDESQVSYVWEDESSIAIGLASSANTAHFIAPANLETASIKVTATYQHLNASDSVQINLIDPNTASAKIGNLTISGPAKVKSSDDVILNALYTENSVVKTEATFVWSQDEGPDVGFTTNNGEISFTAPDVNQDTELAFSAQTTNDEGEFFDTFWFVTVTPLGIAFTNQPNTGQSQVPSNSQSPHMVKQVTTGDTVHLTAQAASAGGGGSFTYAWTQNGSPAVPVTIINPNSKTASFVAPDAGGKLSFTVTATETGSGKSTNQTQEVTIKPKPFITQQGAQHEVFNGHGSLSLKARMQGGTGPFTYVWTQTAGPAATISNTTVESPDVTPSAVTTDTDFIWSVTITDANGLTATTDHVVTVKAASKLTTSILQSTSRDVAEGDTVSPQAHISGGSGTYSIRWSSSAVTLQNDTTETPSFVVPAISKDTAIVLNLVVSDGVNQVTDSVSYIAKPFFIINPHQNQSGSNLATGPTQSTHQNVQVESLKFFKPSVDIHENTATGGTFAYAWTVVKPNPIPSDLTIAGANTAQPFVTAPNVTVDTPVELQALITYTAPNGKSISKTVNSTYQIVPINSPSKPTLSLSMAGHESVYGGRKVNPTVSVMNAAGAVIYKWTQISGPAIVGGITDDTTDHPSFTTPTVSGHQDIVVQVEVNDGSSVETAQVTFAIDPFFTPLPLTVVASQNATVIEGSTVNPRATVTNYYGTPIYAWTQSSGPTVVISGSDTQAASFTAPTGSGTIVLEFTVTEPDNSTATATVTYQIQTAIKVTAGKATRATVEGNTIDLLASVSGVNGTASYAWSVVSDGGSGIVTGDITTNTAKTTSLPIPAVDQDRTLVLQVVATDSVNSATATAQITVNIADRHMRIDAGADAHIPSGQTGYLHTNVQGGLAPFTYTWTDSSPATLVGGPTDTSNPSFTAPTVSHSVALQFDVEVTDSLNNIARDSITMTVDQPPFSVDAGVDFSVSEGVTVQLGATGINGTGTTWSWSQTAGQTVSLSDDTIANPTFTAPAQGAGIKETFSFTVTGTSNGQAKSDSINLVVTGVPDIAAHTNNVTVHAGATVTLAGSVTGTGTVAKLEWSQTSNGISVGTLTNPTVTGDVKALNTTFVAPAVNADTTLTFDFLATGTGNSQHVSATVTIIANPLSVSAGSDIRVKSGATVQLHAVSSNAANYVWSQTVGTPTVTLITPNTSGASFVAPDVTADTTLTFEVDVTGGGIPGTDTVDVVVYEPTIVVKTGKPHRIDLIEGKAATTIVTTFADSVSSSVVTPATTTWTITPTPPANVFSTLNTATLNIDPIAGSKGTYTATMTAGDSANHFQAGNKSFVINIKPATPPMPTSIDLATGNPGLSVAGVAGNHSLHAPTITGGLPPYKYKWELGAKANSLVITGSTTDNPTVTFPAVPSTCAEIKGIISLTITDDNGDSVTSDVPYKSTPATEGISCHLCRGPKFICERSHVSSKCSSPKQQYCINDVENLKDGSRYVTRRCATAAEVNKDSLTGFQATKAGSVLDKQCGNYNVVVLQDAHYECKFACKGDNCNLETVPDTTIGLLGTGGSGIEFPVILEPVPGDADFCPK